MKNIIHFLMLFATGLLALSCSETETEATREAKTYAHALSVINEDYYELLVLNELSEPVTVASVNNLPYWLSVEAQEGVNKNGHPVLKLNVKKEDGMQEERQIEGTVTLSTGDIISLTVKQGGDLPTGLNDGDVLTSSNTEFEADWASCKSITLVTSYVDVNGRTQVTTTEVALPWAQDALPQEWLPEDEAQCMVINKDQWELVFNLTGIESRPNYNYFGMYNKYSGQLRIFYYMDEAHMPASDANDHMWSLNFSDDLAEYPIFRYGVPYNKSISMSYKQAVGYPNIQYMTSATTSQMSHQGKVIPRIGWWAYDIDMSQLRPKTLASRGGYITPGMLLFAQDNVFLNSIMHGDIEGSISGKIDLYGLLPAKVNKAGLAFTDIFGIASSFCGAGGMSALFAGSATNKAGPLAQGGILAGLTMGGMMASQINPGSIDDDDKENLGKIQLQAQLNLNAEMETQGTIGGERSTNIASPKISTKYFKAGTHFGEGVWNIQNAPVIYVLGDAFWSDAKNFLAYAKGEELDASGKVIRTYYKTLKDPGLVNMRMVSFMDPTSIGNVLLNNNVYDANAPMEVNQSFGVYPGSEAGYTKGFREGLGVNQQTDAISDGAFNTAKNNKFVTVQRPVDDDLFKYDIPEEYSSIMAPRLSQQVDPTNANLARQFFGPSTYFYKVNPSVKEVDQVHYVADPQVKLPYAVKDQPDENNMKKDPEDRAKDYFLYDPDYVDWVTTVSLRIEQGDRIYIMNRQFMPEVKVISYKDMPALINQMKARKGQIPSNMTYLNCDEMIDRIQRYYDAIKEAVE
jgi:hypothetical protein